MSAVWVFIIGAVLGALVVVLVVRAKASKTPASTEKRIEQKEEHKKKILEILNGGQKVTNNHIQNALGVSDATATRYLDELEKEGKVKQVGKEGRSVYYSKS